MAQTLEEFEEQIEKPLASGSSTASVLSDLDGFKSRFRKRLQAFASDCSDMMPANIEINGYEPIRRGT